MIKYTLFFSLLIILVGILVCTYNPVIDMPEDTTTSTSSSSIHVLSSTSTEDTSPIYGTSTEESVATNVNTDLDAPQLAADPEVSNITDTSAIISFETDESAGCQIEYGVGVYYFSSGFRKPATRPAEDAYATTHSISLTGLAASSAYQLYIICTDNVYNQQVEGPYFFTTEDPDPTDTTDPIITGGPNLISHTDTSATWEWATNEHCNEGIEFSTSSGFALGTGTRIFVTDTYTSYFHSMTYDGFMPATPYYYYILSKDAAGNVGASTTEETFTTDPLDQRLGWVGAGGTACSPTPCFKTEGAGSGSCCGTASVTNVQGIATDHFGNFYVVDYSWNHIHKFQADGKYFGFVGQYDTGGGDCNDNNGTHYRGWSTSYCGTTVNSGSIGYFNRPNDVAVDASTNHIYIADRHNHRIQRWNYGGILQEVEGCWLGGDTVGWHCDTSTPSGDVTTRFNQPRGLAVDDMYIYVADSANHRVTRYYLDTGNFAGCIGGGTSSFSLDQGTCQAIVSGDTNGYFNNPSDIAIGSDGTIYVVDSGNHRVHKWTSSGTFLSWIGGGYMSGWTGGNAPSPDTGEAYFDTPIGIALDDEDTLYITDQNNHRVQKWNVSGLYLGWAGADHNSFYQGDSPTVSGSDLGAFNSPTGVAYDAVNDRLYVGDNGNHRIQAYQF